VVSGRAVSGQGKRSDEGVLDLHNRCVQLQRRGNWRLQQWSYWWGQIQSVLKGVRSVMWALEGQCGWDWWWWWRIAMGQVGLGSRVREPELYIGHSRRCH
jgi:hypothetical protein